MTPYRQQLEAVLAALTVRGTARYTWLGRHSREPERALDAAERRAYLRHCVREELYWSFYCRGGVGPARWGEAEPIGADAQLVRAIWAANSGSGGWEDGWRVERVVGDDAVLTADGVRVRVKADLCDVTPVAGAAVRLPGEAGPSMLSPGFLTVGGDAGDEGSDGVVRVYWHVTYAGASELVRALTEMLNADGQPFRLKVADHPLRYDRCDAGVLYLRAEGFALLRPRLEQLAARMSRRLRPAVPAFTLPLAPGVGLAEGVGAGESFGERRCSLLAEGVLDAHEQGATEVPARLAVVAAGFARAGLDVDAPYLEPVLAGRHVL